LVKERINELQQRGVCCIDRFLQKLFDSAHNKEDYLDILMEGRFAIILARNKFSEIHIEYWEKGPDIKANWNRNMIYFEVTRKRPNEEDEKVQNTAAFVSLGSTENIISKIQGKLRQLQSDEINIVVISSDTISWNQHQLEKAFECIRQEIRDDPEKYKDLGSVLFTNGGGVYTATSKQFYLFKNDVASKRIRNRLTKKLESIHEQNPKKLQKEWEDIAAAMKRLAS
ncbi:hypothetical protein ACFLVN_04395, partial [Chloroflexota bacterium]